MTKLKNFRVTKVIFFVAIIILALAFAGWVFNIFYNQEKSVSRIEDENAPDASDISKEAEAASAIVYDDIKKESDIIFSDHSALFYYIKKFGPETALDRLFALEAEHGNCHDTAHFVGRYAYEIYGTGAFGRCAMLCQSGCYHGAMEAYFKEHGTSDLANSLNSVCASLSNPFIKHQCLHGMGHGLMAWSSYQLFDALDSCDLLENFSDRESCYTGVFIENVVQSMAKFLGLEGHVTDYLRDDDPHYPCTIVDDRYKPTCYFLQTDHMVKIFNSDFSKVASACGEVKLDHARRLCFESMGRTIGSFNRKNPSGAIAACQTAPLGDTRNWCFRGAVQDSFWDSSGQDLAIIFCRLLDDKSAKDICYGTIFERAQQLLAAPGTLENFCGKTEENYQGQCAAHIRRRPCC